MFAFLLNTGLDPASRLVEIGCGVLRCGFWLINFLDPKCYFGIEPHKNRLEMGLNTILEKDMVTIKNPRFDTNSLFDTSVFGEKFDYYLAYSIWTHASKDQIKLMLDSFIRDSTPQGIFLTTYLPADEQHDDYMGHSWIGTSHESDIPGCIHHDLQWIKKECAKRKLVVKELGRDKTHGQSWLDIRHEQNRS